jgi:hypothetical protein
MADRKKRFRIGLVVLLAISLFVCPLAAGGLGLRGANAQIPFTPNIATLELGQTVEGPRLGAVTPVPPVGPGQYFEEGDPNRPAVLGVQGDEQYGWAHVAGHPELVLIWYTDTSGTHYLVLDGTSDAFLGSLDRATGTRLEDGFEDYITRRETLERERLAAAIEGFGSGAVGIAAAALIAACPETGGAGCLGALLVLAASGGGNVLRNIIRIVSIDFEMGDVEDSLRDSFQQARLTGGN